MVTHKGEGRRLTLAGPGIKGRSYLISLTSRLQNVIVKHQYVAYASLFKSSLADI